MSNGKRKKEMNTANTLKKLFERVKSERKAGGKWKQKKGGAILEI